MENCNSCDTPVFSIFQGNSKILNMKALYADTLDPLDLTLCTEITVSLPNADGTFTELKYSGDEVTILTPVVLGKFSVPITALVSADLNVGELQTIYVTFTVDGQIFTVAYTNTLSVFET